MFANRFTAVIDACVLADAAKRDLVLSLAEAGLYRLRWSDQILAETHKALLQILKDRPDPDGRARSIVEAMSEAFEEADDDLYKDIVGSLNCLPDPNDHHVLAVAIATQASVIVTDNVRDFPAPALLSYSLEAKSADEFIADSIDLDYPKAIHAVRVLRERLNRPAMTSEELLEAWRTRGMIATVDVLSPHVHQF